MIYRDVIGYEDNYEVSSTGNVRSKLYTKKVLLPDIGPKGHYRVTLFKNGKRKRYMVHRIVAEAFIGQIPLGMEVCHNDSNPSNNNVKNLRIDTRSGNFSDKLANNTHSRGSNHHKSKLDENCVIIIKSLAGMIPQKFIADCYNVTQSTVSSIQLGKSWNWISSPCH